MGIKVYFDYQGEPPSEQRDIVGTRKGRESYRVKITLPDKWLSGPCAKLLSFFCDTYNSKFPDKVLVEADMQLRCGSSEALPMDGIVSNFVFEYNDVLVVHKLQDLSKAKRPEGALTCTNYGCGKFYVPEENHAEACRAHSKPPIFHDTHKYWACCPDRKALDWEQFEAIPSCTIGPHSTKVSAVDFKQSAQTPLTHVPLTEQQIQSLQGVAPTSAEGGAGKRGPREFEGAQQTAQKPQEIIDGKATCRNFGCQKQFVVAENNDAACTYHKEGPVFWDTYKYWKCCPHRKGADFNDFVAIPGCCTGPHKL